MKKEKLFLFDGHALAYRCHFAYANNPLRNSIGQNTSMIYGFVTYLNKIIENEKPDYIAVVFDTNKPTFRHLQYEHYKAHREMMPEEMIDMLDMLKEVVRAYNIPSIELDGFEADDIIGTLAKRAEKENVESLLVTPDKDYLQLVTHLTKVYRPGKFGNEDEIVDENGVVEKFGVPPHQVIEILGLIGDSADNIPGVPGIGPKTAEPLVKEFGTIENILANIDKVSKKGVQEKLRAHKDLALLSKQLVTIDTNVPVVIDFHELKAKEKNTEKLIELFTELDFRSLIRKLKNNTIPETKIPEEVHIVESSSHADITTSQHNYIIIDSDKTYLSFLSELKKAKAFVFDTETTSTNALQAELVGLSFCIEPHTAYYLPVETTQPNSEIGSLFSEEENKSFHTDEKKFSLNKILADLRPTFENEKIKKYGQNVKYDMLVLSQHDIDVRGIAFDSMLAAYVLRADSRLNLDALTNEYLNYKMVSFEELTQKGKKDIREIPVHEVGNYSAEDADVTFQLVDILHDKLAAQGTKQVCTEIEFPLITVLANMEKTGIAIDIPFLKTMSSTMEQQLAELIQHIYDDAGEKFNIN